MSIKKFNKLIASLTVITALIVSGCGTTQVSQPSKASQTGQSSQSAPVNQPQKLNFAYTFMPGIGDLPSLIALDNLKAQGWTVNKTTFSSAPLGIQALTSGQADIATASVMGAMQAIQQGSPIKIIAEAKRNDWFLVAPTSFTDPAQLDKKKVAIFGYSTTTDFMVKWTDQKYNINPQILIMPESTVREQALIKGQIDATPLDMSTVQDIQAKEPGKFHVLVDYAKQFPQLHATVIVASTDFIQNHADVVQGYLKALLAAAKDANANPAGVSARVGQYLQNIDPKMADNMVKGYVASNVWPSNGAVDEESAKYTTSTLGQYGIVKPKDGFTYQNYYDFAPLQKAVGK